MFSKILVAFDGSKPSLEAVESAMEIGNKYNSSLIILHILDGYKYPYLLSSVVLAPTYGSDKLEKEKQKFEELMNSLREKYSAGKRKILSAENDKVVLEGTSTLPLLLLIPIQLILLLLIQRVPTLKPQLLKLKLQLHQLSLIMPNPKMSTCW